MSREFIIFVVCLRRSTELQAHYCSIVRVFLCVCVFLFFRMCVVCVCVCVSVYRTASTRSVQCCVVVVCVYVCLQNCTRKHRTFNVLSRLYVCRCLCKHGKCSTLFHSCVCVSVYKTVRTVSVQRCFPVVYVYLSVYRTARTVSVQRCFTAVHVCLSVYRAVRTVSVQRCFTVVYVYLCTKLNAQ